MSEPEGNEPTEPRSRRGGTWMSVGFWLLLTLAAAIYAAVALSPKLVAYLELKKDHYETQVKLVTLERQVEYLRKVVHAFQNDPEFAAEQARLDFDATRPGDERIPVQGRLDLEAAVVEPNLPSVRRALPWYAPLLVVFGEDQKLRYSLLATAASITLFAFTFLHASQVGRLKRTVQNVARGFKKATSRYLRWNSL